MSSIRKESTSEEEESHCCSGDPDVRGRARELFRRRHQDRRRRNNDAQSCTNKIKNEDAPVVTLWAWYPNSEAVVDNFNEEHDDVQVCWTNAGAGGDAYDKFQTAISAGSGAPDVMMVEADRIATFQAQDALVDLTDLGYEDVKDNFSEGAWKDVSVGDAVYGAPIDGGPMGMIYRTDIFDEYGITPPTTWEELEATAQKVKDAGGPVFASFAANQPAEVTALMYQNGARAVQYDPANEGEIGINLNSDEIKQVLDYWAGLVEKGLVGTEDQFTPSTSRASSAATTRPTSLPRGPRATSRARASARVPTQACGRPLRCRSGTPTTRSRSTGAAPRSR